MATKKKTMPEPKTAAVKTPRKKVAKAKPDAAEKPRKRAAKRDREISTIGGFPEPCPKCGARATEKNVDRMIGNILEQPCAAVALDAAMMAVIVVAEHLGARPQDMVVRFIQHVNIITASEMEIVRPQRGPVSAEVLMVKGGDA